MGLSGKGCSTAAKADESQLEAQSAAGFADSATSTECCCCFGSRPHVGGGMLSRGVVWEMVPSAPGPLQWQGGEEVA